MKYQSIQLLRAFAALMVVVFHSKSAFAPQDREALWWWPGLTDHGSLGVALFFVISGFIIANVLDRPTFSLPDYLWRRFLRIFPLYWLVMLAGLATFYWRGWFAWDVENADWLMSFLVLPQQEFPFWQPGWSLEHELIFYVIAASTVPFFGLRGVAMVMAALAIIGSAIDFGWDYHLFDDVQYLFAAGVLAYLTKEVSWRLAAPITCVGMAIAYSSFYGIVYIREPFPTIAFGIGSAALIVVLLNAERVGWKAPQRVVAIGDASYSLYLWHWLTIPIVSTVAYKTGGETVPEFWRWIVVATSIMIALASYRWIEKPLVAFSHRRWWARRPAPAE